jgi:outer membrane immunogenic protein
MTKFIFASVSAVALMAAASFAPASAADIYRRDAAPSLKDGPVYMPAVWQGLYVGAHVGGEWGDLKFEDGRVKDKMSTSGAIGGGQVGYNFQRGAIVFGAEVDFGAMDLSGSKTVGNYRYESNSWAYADFTGRFGIATGNTLIYAKGGAAVLSDNDVDLWGWTAGAGVEHMLRPNWSVKLEYQHFDFGDEKYDISNGRTLSIEPVVDTVKIGVNYHFNRPADGLK